MAGKIEIKNVTKIFVDQTKKENSASAKKVVALNNVNLLIPEGSFVSLIGPSGCGKTTLLRCIAGLEHSTEGEILVDGKKVTKPGIDRGFAFQQANLFPWLTIRENISFGLRARRLFKTKAQKKEVDDFIELVGLSGFEKSYPRQLSGGMAQRVAIARALANKPRILLLDEPFGALDAITKIHLQEQLLKIWRREKITMIIVTHDIDEAVYLGEKVIVMTPRPGRIKQIHKIELSAPRRRTGAEFTKARDLIYKEFFSESELPIEYNI